MTLTPEERKKYYLGEVRLESTTGGPDHQDGCEAGYQVIVKRGDGLPLSEMELRSVLTNVSWAIDGQESFIDLERI
ncbi:hypothetical protein [Flavobacterium sp.]|uniref:hypothetical protein n=1 Tax=Flavobacterium sp. TaxID=239 RepID=UPI0026090BFD|nr:hypothetical protein [Flavobacterium sp.]